MQAFRIVSCVTPGAVNRLPSEVSCAVPAGSNVGITGVNGSQCTTMTFIFCAVNAHASLMAVVVFPLPGLPRIANIFAYSILFLISALLFTHDKFVDATQTQTCE